ncbi:MAG TPA: hypothetical protein PK760_02360 [Flavobacteriales bacterium]|nr:hypothetical protein [Flavobacteriales bacterium]
MKITRWLLALQLLAIAGASAVAIWTDRDSDRINALCWPFLIVGAITAIAAFCFLIYMQVKCKPRGRDIALLVILMFIGFYESRISLSGLAILRELLS